MFANLWWENKWIEVNETIRVKVPAGIKAKCNFVIIFNRFNFLTHAHTQHLFWDARVLSPRSNFSRERRREESFQRLIVIQRFCTFVIGFVLYLVYMNNLHVNNEVTLSLCAYDIINYYSSQNLGRTTTTLTVKVSRLRSTRRRWSAQTDCICNLRQEISHP